MVVAMIMVIAQFYKIIRAACKKKNNKVGTSTGVPLSLGTLLKRSVTQNSNFGKRISLKQPPLSPQRSIAKNVVYVGDRRPKNAQLKKVMKLSEQRPSIEKNASD